MKNLLILISVLGLCSGCLPLLAASGANSIYGWEKDRAIEKRVSNLEQICLPGEQPKQEQEQDQPSAVASTPINKQYTPRIWSRSWNHGAR